MEKIREQTCSTCGQPRQTLPIGDGEKEVCKECAAMLPADIMISRLRDYAAKNNQGQDLAAVEECFRAISFGFSRSDFVSRLQAVGVVIGELFDGEAGPAVHGLVIGRQAPGGEETDFTFAGNIDPKSAPQVLRDIADELERQEPHPENEPESLVGRKNIYKCQKCGGEIVTIDTDEGVTPVFLAPCFANNACGGVMQSALYHVPQDLIPNWEFFAPQTDEELVESVTSQVRAVHEQGRLRVPFEQGLEETLRHTRKHAAKGGLLIRQVEQ